MSGRRRPRALWPVARWWSRRGGERAARPDGRARAGGRTALELPLTRQVDPEDGGAALQGAAATVRDNEWVVLTSVTAVERFMGALRDARDLGSVLVAAVGPATADALERAGVEPDLVPAEHSAGGSSRRSRSGPGAWSGRVLFPSADLALQTIPAGSASKGWDVRGVEAYRTVARAAPEPALLDRVAAADALTFTAPSAVHAFGPCAPRTAGRCRRRRSSSASGRPRPRPHGRPGSTTCARPGVPRPRASSTS